MAENEEDISEAELADLISIDEALNGGKPLPDIHALSSVEMQHASSLMKQIQGLNRLEDSEPSEPDLPTHIGPYEIRGLLGCGGFAIVYLGWHPEEKRHAAIKIPLPRGLMTKSVHEKFLQEAETTIKLKHPHIVSTYATGTHSGIPYIAFAYCEGSTLAGYLEDNSTMPWQLAISVVEKLADALHYSHEQSFLHRDIKPSNVLLFRDESADAAFPYCPKLADFGLGKVLENSTVKSGSSVLLGTPQYLAPERVLHPHLNYETQADIYGLGCLLYELISGHAPFESDSLLEILEAIRSDHVTPLKARNPNLPADLYTIVERCLAPLPQDRYSTAVELRDDLERLSNGERILARQPSRCRRLCRWMQAEQRISEAVTLIQNANLAILSWILIWTGAVLLKFQFVAPIQMSDLIPDIIVLCVTHIFFIGISFQIAQRKQWAAAAAFVISLLMLAVQVSVLTQLIPPPLPAFYTNPPMRGVVFLLLICLSSLLVFFSLASWVSIAANPSRRNART